jgi:hypothetical protein
MTGNCLYLTSGLCYKNAGWFAIQASGDCTACILSMQMFGYHNNKIQTPPNGILLMSGAHVQFNL